MESSTGEGCALGSLEAEAARVPEAGWAPAAVAADRFRAFTALSSDRDRDRSVLVADRAGRLTTVTPDAAHTGCLAGDIRLLATRSDLFDAGLRESWSAGRLTGPVVEVCSEAAMLNEAEQRAA